MTPVVSVPVLSVQITVAQPRVSTAGNRRTSTFRAAMRCTPTASAIVTTAGSPSGTAATASETAAINTCMSGHPRSSPATATTATMPPQIYSKVWLTFASRRCSGVTDSSAVASRWAILPSSVCMPVATTSANPAPVVTDVPMNTKSWRSASGVPAAVGETSFATGALSPVKGASFVVNACAV